MRIVMFVAILLLPLAVGAQAPTPVVDQPGGGNGAKSFQFVGFSTDTFVGNHGLGTYALACQADFPSSRMCFSTEILATVDWPPPPSEITTGWVQPVYLGESAQRDVSFNEVGTCDGWRVANNRLALIVLAHPGERYGSLGRRRCEVESAVACCAPVE